MTIGIDAVARCAAFAAAASPAAITSTFCDTSDVSADRHTLRLNYPHLSCGLGLRYDTPIGPVRLDVGYRIPGAQVPKGTDPRIDGDPGTLYGVPIAFAFGIGEAF